MRVELHGVGAPARPLGRDQGGAAADEGVEHDAAAPRDVEQQSATSATGFTVGCRRSSSSRPAGKVLTPG